MRSSRTPPSPLTRTPGRRSRFRRRRRFLHQGTLEPAKRSSWEGSPSGTGGAPCVACHNVSGAGLLGGGTLGPDLTGTYTRFGETGISSVLASFPFPTMKPIFDSRPLTPEEREDLKAFFRQSAGLPSATPGAVIGALAGGGWIALLLLTQAAWRGRLRGVRRTLLTKAAGTEGGGE